MGDLRTKKKSTEKKEGRVTSEMQRKEMNMLC